MKRVKILLIIILFFSIAGCFTEKNTQSEEKDKLIRTINSLIDLEIEKEKSKSEIGSGIYISTSGGYFYYSIYKLSEIVGNQHQVLELLNILNSSIENETYLVYGNRAINYNHYESATDFNDMNKSKEVTTVLPIETIIYNVELAVKTYVDGSEFIEENIERSDMWPVSNPKLGVDTIEFADISSPTTVIEIFSNGIRKSDEFLASEIQNALDKGGVITFDTKNSTQTIKISQQLYIPVQGKSSNEWNNDAPVVIDGGGYITLDGNGSTRILEKAWKVNLTVQNIDFINANSSYVTSGREDDNKSGGAINIENWDGSLYVFNCKFKNCKSVKSGPDVGGGAVRCPGQKQAVFYNCSFEGCSGSNGGTINSLGSELWLLNCRFENSSATGSGGGAEVGPNGQGGIGGAVYIDGISNNSMNNILRVERTEFFNNTANEHGGAIFLYTYKDSDSETLIKETSFHNNTIQGENGFGGAIYSQNSKLNIFSSTFYKNKSGLMGGALWHLSNEAAIIANSTFSENISDNFGSALQLNGETYISSCTIAENICNGPWGGGISGGNEDDVWLKNCILVDNIGENIDNGNAKKTYRNGGGNIQWPYSNTATRAVDGILFADPKLEELSDNGGNTMTRKPDSSSEIINKGTDVECMQKDQCGNIRFSKSDPGSVEF